MLLSLLYFALGQLLRLLTVGGDRDHVARDVEILGGDPCQMHPARGEFDEEENIERLQPDSLHTEEVARYDARGLLGQELLPRRTITSRGRLKAVAAKH